MTCWHCNSELIWGGDHDLEEIGHVHEGILTNFSCPNCPATTEVMLPFLTEKKCQRQEVN